PLLYALDAQLEAIERETVEGRWARHAAMAEAVYRWVGERAGRFGLGVLAPPGERSPTVTAVTLPEGLSGGEVARAIAARGIVVSGGYGTLATRTFRIGHMGDHSPQTLARCLRVCDDALGALTGR
ncbi:MAG TPA: hypothetical protein VNA89_13895, partial [Gemmatimonadaceae bacterium]|nr:hypothetical protein [Gemmatimonadaceae bacterium]